MFAFAVAHPKSQLVPAMQIRSEAFHGQCTVVGQIS